MINICPVLHNKKQYLALLLLADEQESMIDRYLERGEMFVLTDAGDTKAACVVTREAEDVFEIKNIATHPQCQRQGYGRMLMEYLQAVCRQMPNHARGYGRQSSDRSFL